MSRFFAVFDQRLRCAWSSATLFSSTTLTATSDAQPFPDVEAQSLEFRVDFLPFSVVCDLCVEDLVCED
eukprot:m.54295 g.54295  ORF g.54295 m.54295 type:complete len:69 (-) comp48719_c0_seq4:2-208(-)